MQQREVRRLQDEIVQLQARPLTTVVEHKQVVLPPWEDEKPTEQVAVIPPPAATVEVAAVTTPGREDWGDQRGDWTNRFAERTPEERKAWEERMTAENEGTSRTPADEFYRPGQIG